MSSATNCCYYENTFSSTWATPSRLPETTLRKRVFTSSTAAKSFWVWKEVIPKGWNDYNFGECQQKLNSEGVKEITGTYSQLYIHIVFAVQGRQNLISKERKKEYHPFRIFFLFLSSSIKFSSLRDYHFMNGQIRNTNYHSKTNGNNVIQEISE